MSRSTISTFKLFELFPDETTAREYLESRLWPNGAFCPQCHGSDNLTPRAGRTGFYRCNACRDFDFTVRTGTIFERSHIHLHKWLVALWVMLNNPDITSAALAGELGVSVKTGWLMRSRIQEAAGTYKEMTA